MVSPFQNLSITYPTILKCPRWEREPGSSADSHIHYLAWCQAWLGGMYMGWAQPGTPDDSRNFPSCFLLDIVSADGTIWCFFFLCVTICSLTQKPHLRGWVFCSQPGTPPMENYRWQPEGDFLGQFLCGRCECPIWWHSICFYLFFYLEESLEGTFCQGRELQPVFVMELPQLVSVGYL